MVVLFCFVFLSEGGLKIKQNILTETFFFFLWTDSFSVFCPRLDFFKHLSNEVDEWKELKCLRWVVFILDLFLNVFRVTLRNAGL